ncbi:hypothetical protein PROSTU_03345 [Providencia stuartii ATCC 25827]|uniref:Uncharacterized protein n=1 Tax=Providencia stuartii ATCC 25827 TaxID=471874 RepID=A0AA86YNI9_PROST|nr:hypothetical protein PROSTU_03345 [Providencia stuartii ATCC 25827]
MLNQCNLNKKLSFSAIQFNTKIIKITIIIQFDRLQLNNKTFL